MPGYPPANGGYPPANGGYPPANGGYPTANGGYPPANGDYPPAQGNESLKFKFLSAKSIVLLGSDKAQPQLTILGCNTGEGISSSPEKNLLEVSSSD